MLHENYSLNYIKKLILIKTRSYEQFLQENITTH